MTHAGPRPRRRVSDQGRCLMPPVMSMLCQRWRWLRIIIGLVVEYPLLVGCAMVFEERLIFYPARYPSGDWHPVGLQYEDVTFATQDGVRLHGWYCPVPRPRGVFLMMHGNGGNITHRVDRITSWQRSLHVSVFVFDYRG